MDASELVPHLFRTEYSKITAVLCKRFGFEYLDVAEDLASETFLTALNTWPYRGLPENPVAWLYTVARNKAKNHFLRERIFRDKIAPSMNLASEKEEADIDLSENNISDSQLRMMFAICVPEIPQESQIGLSLRILCGFGIDEIANAFLTSPETISKRLFRAREKLRNGGTALEFPSDHQIQDRLDPVLTTLYLLFNEGYYSESHDNILRADLCHEAMRLVGLLTQHPQTNRPEVSALLALMCFHASRFNARTDSAGMPVLYDDQDETLWDQELIRKGIAHLHRASSGNRLTRYHLEAGIAYWHTVKADTAEKWESILQLYNHLLSLQYSPIAALNRTYALAKTRGVRHAIPEAEKLRLIENPFYFTLLGELYSEVDKAKAKECFFRALELARTTADKQIIEKKILKLGFNESGEIVN